jgi:hypothetical protein
MLMLALVASLNLAGCPRMALGLSVAGPPWKPVVYAHRATGTGAASLRASASELIRLRVPLPGPARLPVPPARQVYSGDTDQVLLVIPDPDHAEARFVPDPPTPSGGP